MAAGSTDTFGTSSNLGYFNANLLKTTPDKFWSADVLATASTGGFWEDDPEEIVKKKVNELKHKFHYRRQLQIKHLPRDVTEEEIRELLSDFPVQSVFLQCGTGSGTARAVLEDPELLEEWDKERIFLLRGQRVLVCPSPTDMMLCVARLPTTYTEEHFQALVHTYGKIQCSFLMISEKTGESKGYGFVEYTTKESALQAKNILDGLQVENCALCCDWLDSSHVTFESLHSKCLYVDKLPKDFRDMGEFRKVFSSVVNPPYCQIALKNGCPQDWGLVEFATSEDAETAQTTLNKYSLRGHNIRILYYIPGVRAINLYLKLLNDSANKGKEIGLLPDPPAPAVFQQLQNLSKQNPVFAQSLQNIIWTQIQALQNGGENVNKPSPPSTPTLGNSSSGKGKSGLTSSENTTNPPGGTENAQAAMVILLAAQIQTQMGSTQPSLLGNPQMLATLQNLIKQGPPSSTTNIPPPMGPPPARLFHFHPGHITMPEPRKPNTNGQQNGFMKTGQPQKVPLLPNPSVGVSPPPVEVTTPVQFSNPTLDDANKKCVMVASNNNITNQGPSQVALQDPSTFWTGLLGQIPTHQPPPLGVSQLDPKLLIKNGRFDHISMTNSKDPLHSDKVGNDPFSQQAQSGASNISGQPTKLNRNSNIPNFPDNVPDLQKTINTILSNAQNLNQLLGSLTSAIQTNNNTNTLLSNPSSSFSFVNQPLSMIHGVTVSPPHSVENVWPTSCSQSGVSVVTGQNPSPMVGSPVLAGQPVIGNSVPPGRALMGNPVPMAMSAAKPIGFLDMKANHLQQSPFQSGWNSSAFLNSTPLSAVSAPQFGPYPGAGIIPGLWSHPGSPVLIASPPPGLITPIGQKRKYTRVLPSPEPSPEGNYIGQHSQGLGGHYADSYFKRKKKS